jgi:hypothetical protein
MKPYHLSTHNLNPYPRSPLIKTCLRCGSRFVFGGQTFPVFCVEGRVELADVCGSCARLGFPAQERRLAA